MSSPAGKTFTLYLSVTEPTSILRVTEQAVTWKTTAPSYDLTKDDTNLLVAVWPEVPDYYERFASVQDIEDSEDLFILVPTLTEAPDLWEALNRVEKRLREAREAAAGAN
jgi:hypothetical protein